MSRKCNSLRAVLALLGFHMATDSSNVTVPQNIFCSRLQLPQACSILSPCLIIRLDFLCGFCARTLLLVQTPLGSFVLLKWELQYQKVSQISHAWREACSWSPRPEDAAISQQQQNTEVLGSFSQTIGSGAWVFLLFSQNASEPVSVVCAVLLRHPAMPTCRLQTWLCTWLSLLAHLLFPCCSLVSFTAATSSQFSPHCLLWRWRAAFPLASSRILHTGAII